MMIDISAGDGRPCPTGSSRSSFCGSVVSGRQGYQWN